jgi:hypothetical protein
MGFMQAPPPVPTMLQPMSNVKRNPGEKNTDDLDKSGLSSRMLNEDWGRYRCPISEIAAASVPFRKTA